MPKPSDRTAKPSELKRIGDYVQGAASLEGDKVDLDDMLGQEVVLKDYVFIESTKFAKPGETKEFAVIQFTLKGKPELKTTSCGGSVVVRKLKEMPKQYLPIDAMFVRSKNKAGSGSYYDIT